MENVKKITIITGHYGCGKTNFSVNYALFLAKTGKKVVVADFDIVNPYFRTADFKELFEANGIKLIAPQFANTNVDIPTINFDLLDIEDDEYLIVDVGGDDSGAVALGRFSSSIENDDYDMLYVINKYRYLMQDPKDSLSMLSAIENASRLRHTGIVNNSNLGTETTPETVLDSVPYMEKLSELSGLPIFAYSAVSSVAEALNGSISPVLSLNLQEKYFDLPSQKPGNRPLWG